MWLLKVHGLYACGKASAVSSQVFPVGISHKKQIKTIIITTAASVEI